MYEQHILLLLTFLTPHTSKIVFFRSIRLMEGMRLIVGEDLVRDKYTQAPSARFPGSLKEPHNSMIYFPFKLVRH